MPSAHAVTLTVNGTTYTRQIQPTLLLVEFPRETLGLTGTHVGCDTSQCGACTVRVDGLATKACTMLAVQADGAEVITVGASHGTVSSTDPARVRQGARTAVRVCTPGLMLTAVDFLERTLRRPMRRFATRSKATLCRCTGYTTSSTRSARRPPRCVRPPAFSRRSPRSEGMTATTSPTYIGTRVRARKTLASSRGGDVHDDVFLPGMAYMTLVRSPHAHARIRRIDGPPRRKSRVCHGTHGHRARGHGMLPVFIAVPGMNGSKHNADRDRQGEVRGRRAVAAVVAESRDAARRAADLISVDYEPLPVVVDATRRSKRVRRSFTKSSAPTSSSRTR